MNACDTREFKNKDEASDTDGLERVYLDYNGRTVDVLASIEHVFRKHSKRVKQTLNDESVKNQEKRGNSLAVLKQDLTAVLQDLHLRLDSEELLAAQRAFPDRLISLKQFYLWWIN